MEEIINHAHHLHSRSSLGQNQGSLVVASAHFIRRIRRLRRRYHPPPFTARRLAFPTHKAAGDARQTRFLFSQSKRTFSPLCGEIKVSPKTTIVFPKKFLEATLRHYFFLIIKFYQFQDSRPDARLFKSTFLHKWPIYSCLMLRFAL